MTVIESAGEIAGELSRTLSQVSNEDAERLVEAIVHARRVFVAGAGRSGLMVEAFAMRLMHLGFSVYVAGETVTPAIEADDLLVIGSGSGETASLVSMAQKAKRLGSRLALVSIFPDSTIGRYADIVVRIPASTPKGATASGTNSLQPMGSLFEQSILLFLDAIVLRLMELRGQDSVTMFTRHANLE